MSIASSLGGSLSAGEDRSVLRQGEIDDELWPVGRREKLPRDKGHSQKRRNETAKRHGDSEPSHPHRANKDADGICARQSRLAARRSSAAGFLRSTTPSNGANRTATNQETISAMLTTAKIENVYSPAELLRESDRDEARRP